jgi:zinc transport system substrate-binding protein
LTIANELQHLPEKEHGGGSCRTGKWGFVSVRAAIALAAAIFSGASAWGAPLRVMVTVPPQRTFVERVGGDPVAVEVMVPPGADPHTYEPRPAARAALEQAQVYFALGDPFERIWLERVARAGHGPRIVRTDADIRKIGPAPDGLPGGLPDSAGRGGISGGGSAGDAGGDTGGDPHIWLSPPLVKLQAQRIRAALTELDPDGREAYAANFERFARELDTLDGDLRALFKDVPQREFVVFHPAWGYFAAAYGLTQTAIEVDGKNPTPAQLRRLLEGMRARRLRVIFAQPQRSQRMAETVAASVGARVVVADDLSADWERNLRAVAAELHAALTGAAP